MTGRGKKEDKNNSKALNRNHFARDNPTRDPAKKWGGMWGGWKKKKEKQKKSKRDASGHLGTSERAVGKREAKKNTQKAQVKRGHGKKKPKTGEGGKQWTRDRKKKKGQESLQTTSKRREMTAGWG